MTSRARTVVFTGAGEVQVRDAPLPDLGPGEVILRTLYTGISAGTEMNIYSGLAPQLTSRQDPATGLFEAAEVPEYTYPLVYGYAAVSRVTTVAPDVTAPRVGDLVFSYTPHQSASVLAATDVVVLPELPDVRAGVLVANLVTALNGVLDAHPFLGDCCVVSGLGVLGLLVTQLLRRCGPALLVGADPAENRRALARQFGADVTLDPAHDRMARTVRGLTGNRGADIVVEVSGASGALHEAIRTVGYNGRLVAMSWYGGTFESLSLSGEFHHNRPRIIASQVVGLNPELGPLWSARRRMELAVSLLPRLDLAPLLTHTFPVERAPDAYRLVAARDPALVQCVLSYGEE